MALSTTSPRCCWPSLVADLVVIFTKSAASAARINEIFDTLPSVSDGGNLRQALPERGRGIRLRTSFLRGGGEREPCATYRRKWMPGDVHRHAKIHSSGESDSPGFTTSHRERLLVDGADGVDYPFASFRTKSAWYPAAGALLRHSPGNLRWARRTPPMRNFGRR